MKTKVSWLIVYLSGGYQSITATDSQSVFGRGVYLSGGYQSITAVSPAALRIALVYLSGGYQSITAESLPPSS